MVKHFYVKFGDPSCIGFWDIMWTETDRQTLVKNCTPTTVVGVGNERMVKKYTYGYEKTQPSMLSDLWKENPHKGLNSTEADRPGMEYREETAADSPATVQAATSLSDCHRSQSTQQPLSWWPWQQYSHRRHLQDTPPLPSSPCHRSSQSSPECQISAKTGTNFST